MEIDARARVLEIMDTAGQVFIVMNVAFLLLRRNGSNAYSRRNTVHLEILMYVHTYIPDAYSLLTSFPCLLDEEWRGMLICPGSMHVDVQWINEYASSGVPRGIQCYIR